MIFLDILFFSHLKSRLIPFLLAPLRYHLSLIQLNGLISSQIIVKLIHKLINNAPKDQHKSNPHIKISLMIEIVNRIQDSKYLPGGGNKWEHVLPKIQYNVVDGDLS